MSAIAGIVDFNRTINVSEQGTCIMRALEQYPSDDVQIWNDESIFLGCHAQWITPESMNERLPYMDKERQLVITADAIIDNRHELFALFQVHNEHRKTMTDSELILLAYERWGEQAPNYLVGDFVFMIWDVKKRILFGARDFSGSRTLYFSRKGTCISFCTIIHPLLKLSHNHKTLNEQWLAEFLAIPTMADVTDIHSTVFQDIEQLPPSHRITISESRISLVRYSTLPSGEKLRLKSNGEYEEAFRELFRRAVSDRLRTHREIGAHLSGGLDSGAVVSFAARELRKENKPLHTFSYVPIDGFVDWTSRNRVADERPYIQSTVQYVGNITDHYLSFEDKNPFTDIDDWLETLEMPYKFFINSYWLKGMYEKAQEQGIGVLLSGQRGNTTVSWGSALEYQLSLFGKLKWIRFYQELCQYSRNKGVKKSRLIKRMIKKTFPFLKPSPVLDPRLIHDELAGRTQVFERLQEHHSDNLGNSSLSHYEHRNKHFEQLFYWNITGTFGSKLSLRHSLWDRDPTNDLRVVKFCLSLPGEQFVQQGLDRALIRRATKDYLPDKVRLNQRFRGIQGADGVYRMSASWKSFIQELQIMSKDSIINGLLNTHVITAAIEKIKDEPRPEYIFDVEFKLLMRSLIVYRFIKKWV
ncbi:asparagine synthetase B [Paenibacillus sp. LMG 31456]|uniref:asparagine synthase (glutamine-hydrolyzing) n=1 Tax=Paenibacillus foliorum TaxID=2654974 RepID=A0A972GLI7_9BACL|nr:asparagine synthase-related protein [Paenibacillus foliorum]NOU92240.1 asparagine synthetase B [Paenibacillus foliorum]